MIEEMCEVLAKFYPYDLRVIKKLYDLEHSWDQTIRFLESATHLGVVDPISLVRRIHTASQQRRNWNE